MEKEKELLILSPFEMPDTRLVSAAIRAGAGGILHLGKDCQLAKELVTEFSRKTRSTFGICITPSTVLDFTLPVNVTKIIVPFGYKGKLNSQAEILYQVHSTEEAEKAIARKASAIVIKGNEGAGQIASVSSFDIFREIIGQSQQNNVKVYIQGGAGIHTAAAFLALGAHGIIFDSQIALFPECSAPQELKNILLNPALSTGQLAVGEDACLAPAFVKRYRNLKQFVFAVFEAAYGHLHYAKRKNIVNYDDVSGINTGNEEQIPTQSKLLHWEKQVAGILQKGKNFSKFSLVFPIDLRDEFSLAFVSVMASSAAAKGVKIKVPAQKKNLPEEKNTGRVLQAETQKLLAGLEDIPPFSPGSEPLNIAIVGMECIYPAAANVHEYWKNLLLAKDCITEVPDSYWDKDLFYKLDTNTDDWDYSMSKLGGFIPTVDFDPLEFGLIPQSLFTTEPSQMLSLLTTKRALQNAGYENFSQCDFENTSVYFGATGLGDNVATNLLGRFQIKQKLGRLPDGLKKPFLSVNEYTFPGVLPNIVAGRIANRLDFGGRNFTVDAACASSFAALDIACQELRNFRSDMAVVGGTELHNTLECHIMFTSLRLLSLKGRCAAFDANADGIVFGEGVGVLVLKRLEDAERDGNKIYGVIKGIGGSSDGRNLGITAPSRQGETLALERAYQNAGIFPSQVGLIEAHGTGTVVGDRVELSVLTDMFLDSGALPGQTFAGSVKSQIGHTKCSAGVAGLIKTVLSVHHGIIPPTIHLDKLNDFYDRQTSPFMFNKQAGLWDAERRIAGISSFGFGGTNFHVVIENYPSGDSPTVVLESWASELCVFRGDTLREAKQLMTKVKEVLLLNNSVRLSDIAYSLALYNSKEVQVSIVAGNAEELLEKINLALEDRADLKIYYRKEQEGKVVFLFPGQGSQRINMARDLFVAFPAMRRLLEQNREYIRMLFPKAAFDEKTRDSQEKALTDTRNSQPLLGIVDLAIAEYLRLLGIVPDMIAGHSYGEIPALCFSGTISPDDLVALSKARAQAILDSIGKDKGKLIAVIISEEELSSLLEGETEVWAVNFNSPKQIVLAGTTPGIEAIIKKITSKKIFYTEIKVDCAFHSPLLVKAEKVYSKVLKGVVFNKPSIPVWSNTTGGIFPQETDQIKAHIAAQLVKPILFTRQIENMYDEGARIFIETGPGRVLLGLVEATLGKKAVTIQTENKNGEGVTCLLKALGQYLAVGKSFNIEKLFEGRSVSVIHIDDPGQYKKSPTGWRIDGSKAVPSDENKLSAVNK
jgi:acyl transferase domain-containing protein